MLSHDHPMLSDFLSVDRDRPIALFGDRPRKTPFALATKRRDLFVEFPLVVVSFAVALGHGWKVAVGCLACVWLLFSHPSLCLRSRQESKCPVSKWYPARLLSVAGDCRILKMPTLRSLNMNLLAGHLFEKHANCNSCRPYSSVTMPMAFPVAFTLVGLTLVMIPGRR